MEKKLFDIQPKECRAPLVIIKNIKNKWSQAAKRIFLFDPTALYERINEADLLNPYKRRHTVSIIFLFQSIDNKCACGCGVKLKGKQTKWASKLCNNFGFQVFSIISGQTKELRRLRSAFIGGYKCETCGLSETSIDYELDHIYPVKFGGGGGWISNYQFKCKKCHREKTNKDFGFKQR